MKRFYIFLFALLWLPLCVTAQRCDVHGRVVVRATERGVELAVVELPACGLWAVADSKGFFTVRNVPYGKTPVAISSLGYVTLQSELVVHAQMDSVRFEMVEENLTLESVVVTAREQRDAMSTSRTIGSTAINHLQMVNASDIASLLPGGKTVNPNLLEDNIFSLRDGGSSAGNAAFGTAVEVDGVRLSTNASLGAMNGASTRSVASTNIEAVEVVTGVPSAEYGDVASGVVRISTRKGKTPWMVTLSTNPHMKQVAASKGFDLGKERGVINSNVEYTRATKNPTSPYTSYARTGLSLNYQTTFAEVLRFNVGVTANIGGMDTGEDPDAAVGEWERVADNALRANTSLKWQLNRSWITNLDFDASVNYADNRSRQRIYNSNSAQSPAVHVEQEGYYFAEMLPAVFFTVRNVDSRELDYAANLKANWIRHWGGIHSHAKVGVAWRANGNVGKGAYYDDPTLAPHGYRPRPYTDIPYMHNVAAYIEETLTLPLGKTSLQLMAGLRGEKTYIQHTRYTRTESLSPRLNLKYHITDAVTVRGGWGITEKLPSFNVLYPEPNYRDVPVFSVAYGDNKSAYVYHTQPYELLYNEALRWQRNRNAEVGVDLQFGDLKLSLVGYFNRTKFPYKMEESYDPYSCNRSIVPAYINEDTPYVMPTNPIFKLDRLSGEIFVRDADNRETGWVLMGDGGRQRTFVKNTKAGNSSPVDRMGAELVVEFPEIRPLRTQLRLDAAYGYTRYVNEGEAAYYPSITTGGSFYPYVGIYPDNGSSAVITYNGRRTHALDANLTATTHIPSIRMIISLRLEASLVKRSQNLSQYKGKAYAFNVDENRNPTGGSIYDGNSYTAMWPIAYLDLDGVRHPFTEAERQDPAFSALLLRSGNAYTYNEDGYDPYFSANLSITKEIGDHVSISFYANNFTNSRPFMAAYASGVKACFTPSFYYGLTMRLKF